MANYPEIIYWLTLINESDLRLNVIKPVIQRWCISESRRLAELFELSPLELSTTFGLTDADAEQITGAVHNLDGQAKALSRWQSEGVEPIIRTDPRYPKRLIHTLPPARQPLVLWIRGAAHLLNLPGVTMLGQQTPHQTTADFIQQLMVTLETEEIGLISGYSRGLDRSTFEMMLATRNGYTMAILPLGLSAFAKTTTKLDDSIKSERTILVSPFNPDTPYQDKLAEARNLLIDYLTLALLIPESDEEAQTRALAALERGLPVFVKANTPENRALLEQGALLLTDPGEVIDWVQQAIVDAALQEQEIAAEEEHPPEALAAAPLAVTAPAAPETSAHEDYALRSDSVPLLDSEEAIEVLSLGGEIPEILRRRLEKKKPEDDE